jgi:hypothetical protein
MDRIRQSRGLSLAVAVLAPLPGSLAVAAIATLGVETYGWGLFVALPFAVGLAAAALHRHLRGPSVGAAFGVATLALAVLAAALIVLGFEGALCIVMALPIGGVAALCGAAADRAARRREGRTGARTHAMAMCVALPLMMTVGEAGLDREPELRPVTTTVVVDAPPDVVWKRVISFPRLPPPTEPAFRAGIAYPIEARIEGSGVGAVRRCRFSTGDFVEPVTAWEPGRLLRFGVTSQPPPMRELSPWGEVHPPHMDGFLRSRRGEFRLTALPGGRTRVEGTTWYENRMWPERYWRVWSDGLIHAIHRRVLVHIARVAERDAAAGRGRAAAPPPTSARAGG